MFVDRKIKKLKRELERVISEKELAQQALMQEADPTIKEVMYGFERISKRLSEGLTITHKYERQPKPIKGRVVIRMPEGHDWIGNEFLVSKWGGTDWAALPCNLQLPDGTIINHVSIKWEYE